MKPVSPVVPGLEPYEINFGVDQPQYEPLPCLRSSRATGYKVMSRWQPSDEERRQIAAGADVYLTQITFGHEFQPSVLVVSDAAHVAKDSDVLVTAFGLDDELNERLANL